MFPSPSNVGRLSKVLLVALLLGCFQSVSNAQPPSPTLDDLMKYGDPQMAQNAERLGRGLARRTWSYRGDDGKMRNFEAAYGETDVTRGKTWVAFSNRIRIELDRLSPKDQKWITSIKRYQQIVERDARELQKQAEIAAEQQRQQEIARQEAMRAEEMRQDPPVTVADVMVALNATVVVDGQPRSIKVKRGETVVVLDARDREVICEIGGHPATLPRKAVTLREVRSSQLPGVGGLVQSAKPAIGGSGLAGGISLPDDPRFPGIPGGRPPQASWPKKLDVDYDFVRVAGGVQIILNDVFAGGVGDSMGLRPGDVILRANDVDLRSDNHFREVVLSSTAPTFLVGDQTGRRRVVRFAPQANNSPRLFEGVRGGLNPRGEFEVRFVDPPDPITRQLRLGRGDVILAVNGQTVRSVDDIRAIAKNAGGGLTFLLLPAGEAQPVRVPIE